MKYVGGTKGQVHLRRVLKVMKSNEMCFLSTFSAYWLVLQTWNRIKLEEASDYAYQVRDQQPKELENDRLSTKLWNSNQYGI